MLASSVKMCPLFSRSNTAYLRHMTIHLLDMLSAGTLGVAIVISQALELGLIRCEVC